ncbi:MAG: ribosome small subunit-dependent GTPase A, partial [Clostridia bacterium]|nr:ribosome small subunit-dependent GTPase A [Clostridia bacterium]
MVEGSIIKTLADLYWVQTETAVLTCKARGVFRNTHITPLVGDRVLCSEKEERIEKILPRKNFLERPAVANIDRLYLIVSAADPLPVPLMIDRLTALAFDREIQPILVLNKTDLASVDWLKEIYKTVPMPIITACAATGEGVEELKSSLSKEGISVFSGNSGVGKSSLLNAVDPNLTLATGQTSKKLGRGRHTTRHVELYS